MGNPYVGEIRIFAGNFAPVDWAFCDGSLLAISQNETLFNLIGTTYGGDGQTTFALPNLLGRIPIHQGAGAQGTYVLGQSGGTETVTLVSTQIPTHTHPAQGSSNSGSSNNPVNNLWANWTGSQYSDQPTNSQMNAGALAATGSNQPHDNRMPYLAVNFIISLFGVYPSQS
ncbi:MAG TPA: tail fiber protein [Candidatus Saccharimonadales bacterium]|nr:tail fiber protein [Candidatus Saccharimonadales bacterium]